ncbi:MAG: stage III sporulation protein AC [Bacillota bacterium]|nr:stage III sporulation protein AC [Candidatus Fermentithermobacillaceae bacterium]HAF67020.1 stage III sporulation protein AC [Clostridiales bacterium UBA9857]HOA70719.1 stage III sporulation protein AC [Bacillota bacterium]HOP71317.1 stage III sporulation protein AC [Bacillota bacterium]HPT36174.1 stage III sporulation protein AC [Bacillota bacterium]
MPNTDLIFKIAGLAIIVSVLHAVVKQAGKEEYAWLITLTGVVIVLSMVLGLVADFFQAVKSTFNLP